MRHALTAFILLVSSLSAAAHAAFTGQTTDKNATVAPCTIRFADITPVIDYAPMRHKAVPLRSWIFGASDDETVTLSGIRYGSGNAARKQFQREIRNKKNLVEPPSIVTINGITETRAVIRNTDAYGAAGFSIISLSGKSIWEITSRSLQDAECFEKSSANPYPPH